MPESSGGRAVDRLRRALPYRVLLPIALLLGLAPFQPQPHLVEKVGMMFAGSLHRPIDIFDLFLHGFPVLLLLVRVSADLFGTKRSDARAGAGR